MLLNLLVWWHGRWTKYHSKNAKLALAQNDEQAHEYHAISYHFHGKKHSDYLWDTILRDLEPFTSMAGIRRDRWEVLPYG